MKTRQYFLIVSAISIAAVFPPFNRARGQAPAVSTSSELYLELNIPAFRLDVFEGSNLVRTYSVAVGMPRYRTPVGRFMMRELTWNPWWYPPPQPWARREKITPPGATNPMGKVKLHLSGGFYLHGTPSDKSIGTAGSHGCVRMHQTDAIALAKFVQNVTGATIDDNSMDALIASWGQTRSVSLPVPPAVQFVYATAEIRRDSLLLHPDIYGRNAGSLERVALSVLAQSQVDTSAIDRAALRALSRRARKEHAGILLSALASNYARAGTILPARTLRNDGQNAPMIIPDCGGNSPR